MSTCRVWLRAERDLGAEHGRQPNGTRRLGEADNAVETIVIGDRQRFEAEAGSFLCQLLGMRSTVEEREVGVAVQLGVRHRRRVGPQQRLGEIGLGGGRYGWRLRLHAGPSPPAFHAGEPGARPSLPRPCAVRSESAASSSHHGMFGLLNPIGVSTLSNTCSTLQWNVGSRGAESRGVYTSHIVAAQTLVRGFR